MTFTVRKCVQSELAVTNIGNVRQLQHQLLSRVHWDGLAAGALAIVRVRRVLEQTAETAASAAVRVCTCDCVMLLCSLHETLTHALSLRQIAGHQHVHLDTYARHGPGQRETAPSEPGPSHQPSSTWLLLRHEHCHSQVPWSSGSCASNRGWDGQPG